RELLDLAEGGGEQVPDDRRRVGPARGEGAPVGCEGQRGDLAAMAGERPGDLAAVRLAQIDGRIVSRRHEPSAVGRAGEALDRALPVRDLPALLPRLRFE